MSAEVTVKLPSIDELIAAIGTSKLKTSMAGAATVVSKTVKDRWIAGKGADNTPFKAGSKAYLDWKASKGRNRRIDMNLGVPPSPGSSGPPAGMALSFMPRKQTEREVVISFSTEQLEKARGNYSKRPNMLKVDDTLTSIGVKAFLKAIRSVVKFTK